MRPNKPARTVRRARKLRRELTLPEALLWRELRGSPGGVRFRKQHPAGTFVLDFICARANLAIEIDGMAHDMGNPPQCDLERDAWLARQGIETVRVPAGEVLRDASSVAEALLAFAAERLERFGKAPPSAADAAATSPSQVDGEDQKGES